MVLRLITVGKISPWAKEAYSHFSKMISKFARVEHISLSSGGDLNRENPIILRRREARKIRGKIKGKLVCLDRRGKEMDSKSFAEFLSTFESVTFVVGGPLGLDEDFLSSCDYRISLSNFTLSHEVAFLVLLEQIFRGFKISRGERYHY